MFDESQLNIDSLSDRQRKLLEKIKAKQAKVEHLNTEVDRIRAKEVFLFLFLFLFLFAFLKIDGSTVTDM
jgi:hypothetical protein